ncbi:MAG: CBS domain-containing protein, partial [Clostridiales bacterium]|nr:CBS domain-containing protein [Clostridiales bacterium]
KAAIADKKPDIRRLMREPLFVHMTMTTADLLQEFRERRLHMAVVVDEYGGTMGILTLEDVLEEIVGDIWDEKDVIESDYTQDVDGAWIVDGLMQISELLELAELDDREFESEYTTVGGWATEMLDRFPEVGDSFSYQDLIITVTKTDNMRVDKLRVEKKEESAEDNEDAAVKE